MKKAGIIWIITALLAVGPAWGQPSQGVTVYPAAFFADARPATAQDMVSRLPGFSLENGVSARGYAGTAGNVLVDGARPTAKTDDLSSILQRIPAASVERVEIIRGGAPGIDMQGLSVVANVVRRHEDTSSLIVNANTTYIENGQWVPFGGIEFHARRGVTSYEISLNRTAQAWDDAPGYGYRAVTAPGAATVFDVARRTGIMRLGYALNGGVLTRLWGGDWNNTVTLQTNGYSSGVAYDGGGGSRFDSINRKRNGEFGSRWRGDIGTVNLEALVLQRLGHQEDSNTSAQGNGGGAVFLGSNDTGESIARATLRFGLLDAVRLETGAEGAYNFLDGRSSFASNGTAVALPNANLSVNEKRGEIFATASWKIADAWALEAGGRLEYSQISAGGAASRSFVYPKPRLLLTWSPDANSQVRLRAERTVGQLNFTDFVASSNLAGFGVAAGNSSLRPDQRWQFEAAVEHRFWERGAVVVSLLHEEITDLQDFVPVGGGLDAPGNIAHATSDKLTISGTLPLDFLGLEKGLLKSTAYWNNSSVMDPVTGETRRISNQRNRSVTLELTQDLDSLKSTWGLFYIPVGFERPTWRIAQVSTVIIHNPFVNVFWSYKPTPDWKITLGADNFLPYRFELKQLNYAGPRNSAPPPTVQDTFSRTRPRIYLQVRKTFD